MTPTDERAVGAVELRSAAGSLTAGRSSPARGTPAAQTSDMAGTFHLQTDLQLPSTGSQCAPFSQRQTC